MSSPLADLIRPKKLDEVVGQHLLGEGKPLRKIIDGGNIPNMIFYGPSGTGKTTVARIIAENTNMSLHKLNGTSASTADIKQVISEIGTFSGANGILLYLDETPGSGPVPAESFGIYGKRTDYPDSFNHRESLFCCI